ncbi:18484_t:CDS:10 [Gigaspora margarita]|uniref:18484_t:CDS:1 n=1 Tax=Gigaspora margarita TaxID=4874 RepID=A0ABN7VFX1_GIGMA|nr:18484_t:CDS:10 [Gigaspora margarita]
MNGNPQDDNIEFVTTPSPSFLCPVVHLSKFRGGTILSALPESVKDLHPNLALAGLIQELLIYCANKCYGCPAHLRLDSHRHHLLSCTYIPTSCQNSQWGCDFKGTIKTVKDHLEVCVYEKFKGYIQKNDARVEQLERTIEEQQREFEKLLLLVKKSRPDIMPSIDSVTVNGNGIDYHSLGEGNEIDTFPLGEITCRQTISEHTCGVTSLAYNKGLIYAGAHDGSAKVFKADSGQMIKNLHGHRMSVWALAVSSENERFFSAGSDGTIKVWDLKEDTSDNCISTLTQHNGKIYGLVVSGNRLYSASSDKTIKVWDPVTLENISTFTGHTDGVNNLIAMDHGKLVTAGSDNTVKIWDAITGTCIQTISSHSSEVLDVTSGDNLLFASTYDAVIHVYNLNDYSSVATLSGHNWEVWQLEYTNGSMFSASFDHTIKRWDVRNHLICNATLRGFVHAMTLGYNNLITGCADKTIKVC